MARYGLASLTAIVAALVCYPLSVWLEPGNLVMVFLAAVALAAYLWGRGPSVLASLVGVLLYDYFFVPPFLTFAVHDKQYLITFGSLVVGALVISALTTRAQEQAREATRKEEQTAALYALSRALADASDIRATVEEHAGRQAGARARLVKVTRDLAAQTVITVGTETLCVDGAVDPASRRVLEAMLSQAGLALERERLRETERQAELLRASEALQSALLNSVSHDLRIPLVSITGALSALCEEEGAYQDPDTRRALLENARSEADRLNRLVTNLLQLSRMESGPLKLEMVPCDVVDLIATTLPVLGLTEVELDLEPDLPLVNGDYVLLQLVLLNLLDNAQKYAKDILVSAHARGDRLELAVSDRGPGIPPGEPIFDRFHRGSTAQGPGTGLGLSICHGLVQAHGGTITYEPREGGGTTFRVRLPLTDAPRTPVA